MSKTIQFPKDKSNLTNESEHNHEHDDNQDGHDSFYRCEKCNNAKFNQVFVLTIVTPFENPELDEDTIMPIPVFECTECKKLINVFKAR